MVGFHNIFYSIVLPVSHVHNVNLSAMKSVEETGQNKVKSESHRRAGKLGLGLLTLLEARQRKKLVR